MRRILPLLLAAGVMPAASTLEKAGDAVRREKPSRPTPAVTSDDDSGSSLVEGLDFLGWLLRTVFGPVDHGDFEDEPLRWQGEVGLSAARHSGDLWRWGGDGAVVLGSVGLRLRFDGWREDDDGRTVLANLFAVGPQRSYLPSWRQSSFELGLPLLIWGDGRGTEYGLGLSARFRGRPLPRLAAMVEGTFGFVGSARHGRIAFGAGPAWNGAELHLGYEHVDVGGVYLGGPFIRLAYGW